MDDDEVKRCCVCDKTKPRAEFNRCTRRVDGLQTFCRVCEKKYQKDYYARDKAANPQRYAAKKRKRHLKERYGLTEADYIAMVSKQNGKCSGCDRPLVLVARRRPAVDHCHKTGDVRGILCAGCNTALGGAKDSPDTLRRLAVYLERAAA